jgi:hypothetical protein
MKRKLAVVTVAFAALTVGFGAAPAHAVRVSDHIDVSGVGQLDPIQADVTVDTSQTGLLNLCVTSQLLGIARTCTAL